MFYPSIGVEESKGSPKADGEVSPQASPRTKITRIMKKEQEMVVPEILKLRMSAPRITVTDKNTEPSPREEQRQSSFFRRIFCLSPKKQSPRVQEAQSPQRVVTVQYQEVTEAVPDNEVVEQRLTTPNRSKSQAQLKVPNQNSPLPKSSSQLSLKLQPMELTEDFIQAKMVTMMTLRPIEREIQKQNRSLSPSHSSPQVKAPSPKQMIVQQLSPKQQLWQLLEQSLRNQSPKSIQKSHKSLSQSPSQELPTYQIQEFMDDSQQLLPIPEQQNSSLKRVKSSSSNKQLLNSSSSKKTLNNNSNLLDNLEKSLKTNILLQQKLRMHSQTTRNVEGMGNNAKNDYQDDQTIRLKLDDSFSRDLTFKSRTKLDTLLLSKKSSGRNQTMLDPYNEKPSVKQFRTLSSTHQSKTSLVNAKAETLKIKKIMEIQRQNKNLSLIKSSLPQAEPGLFHKSPLKQRSKSVIKPNSYRSNPKSNKMLLPQIKQGLSHNSSYVDDQQLEQALQRYLGEGDQVSFNTSNLNEQSVTKTLPPSTLMSLNSSQQQLHEFQISPTNRQINYEQDLKNALSGFNNDQERTTVNDQTILMSVMNLMMKHPIFKKMQKSSVKRLLQHECCHLMMLKKNQVLYKEEEEGVDFFIPVYGSLSIWSKKNGQLGKVITGFTAGEEVYCDPNYVCRLDNCYADQDTCLFAIDRKQYLQFRNSIDAAKDQQLLKDMNYLEQVLQRNYIIKRGWRSGGISKLIQGKKIKDLINQSYVNTDLNNSSLL